MPKGTTFKATAPDGTIVTRTSKTMLYKFAVLVGPERSRLGRGGKSPGFNGWGAWGWSQSEAGAAKMAREAAKCWLTVEVVPAEEKTG